MDRSLFPDGVEVHQADLTRESSAKAAAILRRHIDVSTMGVVSGLVVSAGSDTTKVKVSPGLAYTPAGELISVTSTLDNIALTDYTAGALNYVCLVYTEVESHPKPHEDLGITLNTAAVGSYRVAVLTQGQYNTLLPTDPNFSNNALDRVVLLAIVAASGAGIQINPVGIQNASVYATITTISQPINILGVSITAMDGGMQLGNGTLTYNPTSATLTWQAPGDSAGGPVSITVDGNYNLPSNTAGYSITVAVLLGKLPGGTSIVTDTLTVSSLYSQSIPRFTPRDEQHRHFVGSGTPTVKNPHGLAPEDIGLGGSDTAGAIAIHRRQQHPAMLGVHNSQDAALCVVNPSALPNNIVINQLGPGDYAFVGGNAITAFTGSPLTLSATPANANPGLYEVFVDGSAILQLARRIDMTGATQFPVFAQLIDLSEDWNSNFGPITVAYNPAGSGSISINGISTSLSTLSNVPGAIRVYANANQNLWVDMWVYPASRPGAVLSEVWQVLAPVDPTRINSLVLGSVHWSGNASGHFGYKLGASSAGVVCDKRFTDVDVGRKGGYPGASLGINRTTRQGQLVLSKDGVQDVVLDWTKLSILISGSANADSLHTHTALNNSISAEQARATAAESNLQTQINTLSSSISTETTTRAGADTNLQNQINTINTSISNINTALAGKNVVFVGGGYFDRNGAVLNGSNIQSVTADVVSNNAPGAPIYGIYHITLGATNWPLLESNLIIFGNLSEYMRNFDPTYSNDRHGVTSSCIVSVENFTTRTILVYTTIMYTNDNQGNYIDGMQYHHKFRLAVLKYT